MLKFAKFIGANTDFATAQAFLFPRAYSEGSNNPVFGLLISGEGEDIFVFIRQKILSLEENFDAPFERITDKLHGLLETLKTEFAKVENLKLTLFCARENLFYVLQLGDNLVEILSEGKRSAILQNDSPQEKIVSGFIKPGDRILVLSSKAESGSWRQEVISEVFAAPFQAVPDAEVIFAQDELATLGEEALAGVKNIQPVAFILIENEIEGNTTIPVQINSEHAQPKKKFKLKIDFSGIFLSLRKIIRQGFGLLRHVNIKILIAVIIIFVISLVSLGGYLYFKSKESEKNTRRDNLITLIDSGLNQAGSVKDTDQKAAIEKVKKSGEKLKELESLDPKNPRVLDTRHKFDEKSAEIMKIYNNFDLELFMSLDLVKESFQTKRMSFSVGKILVLDDNEKSLVSIGIDLKSPDILAGRTQLGDAKLASINGSNVFTYSPDKGLMHVDLDSEKVTAVSSPDAGWGEIKDIFAFSSNIYVLDSGKNMIWKYAPIQSGFSQKQEYLKGKADLSGGKRLMIDYSVWVLTSQPDILKFTAGNSDYFALSGLEEPLTQIDGLYVTEDLDSVFILDKLNKRILVTRKNGEYLAQYVKDDLGKVDDFFVDEEEKSIYLLIENKIYKIALK